MLPRGRVRVPGHGELPVAAVWAVVVLMPPGLDMEQEQALVVPEPWGPVPEGLELVERVQGRVAPAGASPLFS